MSLIHVIVFWFDRSAFRRRVYWIAVAIWTLSYVLTPLAYAQESREELLAAKPFMSTSLEGLAATTTKDGTPLAVTAQKGINTPLQVINLKTMQRTVSAEQRTDRKLAVGRAYLTLPNRHVLIGTSTGYLYDVDPDTMKVVEHEFADAPRQSFERAVLGDENNVYITASSETEQSLYQFDYVKTTWRKLGTLPDASGGLGYAEGKLYTGSTTSPTVMVIESVTSKQSALPLEAVPAGTISLRVQAVSGGYLYLAAHGAAPSTLVYELAKGKIVDVKPLFGEVSAPYSNPNKAPQPTPTETPNQSTQTQATTNEPSVTSQSSPTTNTGNEPTQQTNNQGSGSESQSNRNTNNTNRTQTGNNTQINQNTQQTVQQEPTEQLTPTVQAPVDAPVYYGALNRYSPLNKTITSLASASQLRTADGSCWVDEWRCVVYNPEGMLGILQNGGRSLKMATPSPLVGGYQPATAVAVSGQNVFAGSSTEASPVLHLNIARKSRTKVVAAPEGGVTSILAAGDTVLAGSGQGEISRYEITKQTTTPGFETPLRVGEGRVAAMVRSGQDVIFALHQPQKNISLIGVYDLTSGRVRVPAQVVTADQAISSLAIHGDVVYAGGSGPNAAIVAYSISQHKLISRAAPVAGAKAISSLVIAADGSLYGVADGTLFGVDSQTLAVQRVKQLSPTMHSSSSLVSVKDKLVASVGGKIYEMPTNELTALQVASGTQLAVNAQGDYIYTRDGALYRLAAEAGAAQAVTTAGPGGGFHLADVKLHLGIGSITVLTLLLAVPIIRLFSHRPTYSIRR